MEDFTLLTTKTNSLGLFTERYKNFESCRIFIVIANVIILYYPISKVQKHQVMTGIMKLAGLYIRFLSVSNHATSIEPIVIFFMLQNFSQNFVNIKNFTKVERRHQGEKKLLFAQSRIQESSSAPVLVVRSLIHSVKLFTHQTSRRETLKETHYHKVELFQLHYYGEIKKAILEN